MRSQTAWEGGFVQKGRSISQDFGNGKRRLPTGRTGLSQRLGLPEDFDQALFVIVGRLVGAPPCSVRKCPLS